MERKMTVFLKIFLGIAGLLAVAPILFLVTGSVMGAGEAKEYLDPVVLGLEGYAAWRLIPRYPTLKNVVELLFDSPEFFRMFWNTMKIACGTLAGQLLFGVPGAWGLARYSFPGKQMIYRLYILLMMMPFQVMMLSEYLVLDWIKLLDTPWAVILPGIFSTFPVFLMYRFFRGIPEEVLAAARVDGAGEFAVFFYIGIPLGSSGILASMLLQFLECFALLEQPIAFLREKRNWPLSLYLPEIGADRAGFAFCASLVALLPAVLLFLTGQDYLEQGITAALKE